MSEHKFTPGPWCAMPNESDKPYVRIRGTRLGGRFKVANVLKMPTREGEPENDAEETRANARLIAAAPELLAAAREAHAAASAYLDDHSHIAPEQCYATGPKTGNEYHDLARCPGCQADASFRALIKSIGAALAKATGSTP